MIPTPAPLLLPHAFSLQGRIALVTGSARGIGKGIAEVLMELGASVMLNDVSPRPRATMETPESELGGCPYFQTDMTDEAAVNAMFDAIEENHGPVDIVINNAGTSRAQSIEEISLADWETVMRTNLTSVFISSKAAFTRMKPRGRGRIVNVSSMVAHQGALYGHAHYASSKSAILGFTRTLARTAAPHGITVNAVAPGVISSDLLENTHGSKRIRELAASIPLGLGSARDVGYAVGFLCSDAAGYITGTVLDINGGMLMR